MTVHLAHGHRPGEISRQDLLHSLGRRVCIVNADTVEQAIWTAKDAIAEQPGDEYDDGEGLVWVVAGVETALCERCNHIPFNRDLIVRFAEEVKP